MAINRTENQGATGILRLNICSGNRDSVQSFHPLKTRKDQKNVSPPVHIFS